MKLNCKLKQAHNQAITVNQSIQHGIRTSLPKLRSRLTVISLANVNIAAMWC